MRGENFKNLITTNHKNTFIGSGNPYSNILIIGKEAAIDRKTQKDLYKQVITNNSTDWKNNLSLNITQEDVNYWFDPIPIYNPLYPFKGQLNKIENSRTKFNRGTSTTFYNYQKLIDKIYRREKSSQITFHENAFITEINDATAKYSKLVNKEERSRSLKERAEILNHPFFQSFPIIIVAVGHYVRDHEINLEKLFDVKFDKQFGTFLIGKTNYINIHHGEFAGKKKILIHTNQLSINISNNLLDEIAALVQEYL